MISKLTIDNIALVDKLSLNFDAGLSVLSGETGAGKSVIVTAISLVLGGRAEKEFIRQGFKKASVTAEFDISPMPTRYKKEFAEYITDGKLLVSRELTRSGQSKVKINDALSSVARLKELTAPIAEIIGQHASQLLMAEENHLDFLDTFAGLQESKQTVKLIFGEWDKSSRDLSRLINRRDRSIQERELLLFQQKELQEAELSVGEEDSLIQERKILDSSRALIQSASVVTDTLDGETGSALELVRNAIKELDKMAEIDQSLKDQLTELTEIGFRLADVRQHIEQYGTSLHDDQPRLEEINHRLDEIYRLKKKYGGSEETSLNALAQIKHELTEQPDVDSQIEELERQNEQYRKTYSEKAVALSDARKKASTYLRTIVLKELTELAINAGGFEFELSYEDDPDGILYDDRAVRPFAHGLENGRILFSANPGEKPQSLVKTASGGELSRVLLALKAAEAKRSRRSKPLLIFDEVDAGIGGKTAIEVGRKLKKLAEKNQIIVITHLHQIARLADHHYLAEKSEQAKRSVINVSRLDGGERRLEIDRMVALPE